MDNLTPQMFVNNDIFSGVPLDMPNSDMEFEDVFNEIELPDGSTVFEVNPEEDLLNEFEDDFTKI